jgi:hypothetical protein
MNFNKYLTSVLVILLLVIVGLAIYFYTESNKLEMLQSSGSSKEKSVEIISKVSSLILLPKDEEPTIATVSDLEKLKDQPFFAKAKVGDKVLMYPKSKKAYLYDTVNNKILEVAPIVLETDKATDSNNDVVNVKKATSTVKVIK